MLYKQGTQRIEVIVRKDGGMGASGGAGAKETDAEKTDATGGNSDGGDNTGKSKGMSARKQRIIKTNLTHALAAAKQQADYAVEFWLSGIGYVNGDQAHEDQMKRKMEQIQDRLSIASSIAMGMMYGSWGGPAGMVVGGALGAVQSGSAVIFRQANRRRDYAWEIFKENNSIAYQQARASRSIVDGRNK